MNSVHSVVKGLNKSLREIETRRRENSTPEPEPLTTDGHRWTRMNTDTEIETRRRSAKIQAMSVPGCHPVGGNSRSKCLPLILTNPKLSVFAFSFSPFGCLDQCERVDPWLKTQGLRVPIDRNFNHRWHGMHRIPSTLFLTKLQNLAPLRLSV